MKITLTGSLGHISKPLATELVQKGHEVIVISSKADKQKEIEALGAMAAIGSIEDVKFLATAFEGADAVYTMVPPPNFMDPGFDAIAHVRHVVNNYVTAIRQAGVKRVVHLSSIGAHMMKDSGLIMVHHDAETILSKLSDLGLTFMRPVGFYYNLLSFVPTIKHMGAIASNYGGDDLIPWVSPIDIATAIAEEIVKPLSGKNVVYVASEEMTCKEVAGILGTAIGKPDLQWNLIDGEQLQTGMEQAGLPKQLAAGLVEMNAAMHNGLLFEDYNKHKPQLSKTKLTEFAKEFAAAYAGQDQKAAH